MPPSKKTIIFDLYETLITQHATAQGISTTILPTITIVEQLHKAGHLLYILSSASTEHLRNLEQAVPLVFEPFSAVLSATSYGIPKTNPMLYKEVIKELECQADSTIFIDDQPAHVKAAQRADLHGILFYSTESLQRSVQEMVGHSV